MRKLISMLAIGLAATACSTAGATGSATPAGGYDVATDSNQLVLEIKSGGGLVPISYTLTYTPRFALYGDGRIIVTGPVKSSYPSPLLPNLRQARVTPAEVQKILAAADGAGLLGADARFDAVNIFDAGTTTFTTTVAGRTHTISAYALGYEGVSAAGAGEEAARKKLSAFQDQMTNLSVFLSREVAVTEAYEATASRVFLSASESADAATAPQVVAWPLSVDPATAGDVAARPNIRCLLLTGPDLATFLTAARTASTATVWTYGKGRYSVMVRPLYPHESGCPSA